MALATNHVLKLRRGRAQLGGPSQAPSPAGARGACVRARGLSRHRAARPSERPVQLSLREGLGRGLCLAPGRPVTTAHPRAGREPARTPCGSCLRAVGCSAQGRASEGMGQWALGTLDRVPHKSVTLLHCKTQQLAKPKNSSSVSTLVCLWGEDVLGPPRMPGSRKGGRSVCMRGVGEQHWVSRDAGACPPTSGQGRERNTRCRLPAAAPPFRGRQCRGWASVLGCEWRLLETGLSCRLPWTRATVPPGQTRAGPVTAQVYGTWLL